MKMKTKMKMQAENGKAGSGDGDGDGDGDGPYAGRLMRQIIPQSTQQAAHRHGKAASDAGA